MPTLDLRWFLCGEMTALAVGVAGRVFLIGWCCVRLQCVRNCVGYKMEGLVEFGIKAPLRLLLFGSSTPRIFSSCLDVAKEAK